MKTKRTEFQKFEAIMRDLLRTSHGKIKAKLDAEKKVKAQKKRRKKLRIEKQS